MRTGSGLLGAAVASTILVLLLVIVPAPADPDLPGRFDGARTVAATLRGDGPRADFAADYVGARALLNGRDPYPLLADAFKNVGLDWPVYARSTHPPTAEVLALPVARFSWATASAIWAWLMLIALVVSGWALGLRLTWAAAVAMLAVLLWPPAAWSVCQLTALWLLGAAVAWRWREQSLFAGLAIGLAALTKLFPALLLAPFLLHRRWNTATGLAAVFGSAMSIALILNPHSLSRFLEVGSREADQQRFRLDNGSLPMGAFNHAGQLALAAALLLMLTVATSAILEARREPHVSFDNYCKWLWLTVALLPVAWVYSLLALTPILMSGLRSRRPLSMLSAGTAINSPSNHAPFPRGLGTVRRAVDCARRPGTAAQPRAALDADRRVVKPI